MQCMCGSVYVFCTSYAFYFVSFWTSYTLQQFKTITFHILLTYSMSSGSIFFQLVIFPRGECRSVWLFHSTHSKRLALSSACIFILKLNKFQKKFIPLYFRNNFSFCLFVCFQFPKKIFFFVFLFLFKNKVIARIFNVFIIHSVTPNEQLISLIWGVIFFYSSYFFLLNSVRACVRRVCFIWIVLGGCDHWKKK